MLLLELLPSLLMQACLLAINTGIFQPVGELGTSLDNINSHILDTEVDLLPYKLRRDVVDIRHAKGVLCSQSRSSGHGVAFVSCNHFLISLETTA